MRYAAAAEVADWRRRVHELYRAVRADPEPARAHTAWASARRELLRTHPASPVPPEERDGFAGGRVAPYDPAFRFEVRVDPAEPVRRDVPTATDGVVAFDRVGTVALGGLGSLDVWWHAGYGGGLFLPLHDATCGATTYGGGRYVLDTVKGADLGGTVTTLVVDLNFAYQPSCAYDPEWVCPLAGPGNTVPGPVPVGEQLPPL